MAGTSRSGKRGNPASIRALTGARKNAAHRLEAQYAAVIPVAPALIIEDDLALSKWQTLAPRIAAAGVLTEAHGEMLTLLCVTWADLERARAEFIDSGRRQMVIDRTTNAQGEPQIKHKVNPIASRITILSAQVARFLAEFGLTPMSITKVSAAKQSQVVDQFDQFLIGDLRFGAVSKQ